MTDYIPLASALVGVFIGAFVSLYVARLQFRLNVISTFRQEWIADMRDLLAEYHSLVWRVCFAKLPRSGEVNESEANDALFALIRCTNKLCLMLDVGDPKQKQLYSLFIILQDLLTGLRSRQDGDEIARLQNEINNLAGTVFKIEQERARRGK